MKNQQMEKVTTKNKTVISTENSEIKQFVEIFKNIFDELGLEAQASSNLLEANLRTEFSDIVKKTIDDPVQMNFNALLAIENSLNILITNVVSNELRKIKSKIKCIYRHKNLGNVIHLSILFTKNKTKNLLFPFLSKYYNTVYDARFPLIIQEIPTELEKEFLEEMKLNDNFVKIEL